MDPITAITNFGAVLIDRLLPDKAQNDAAKAQLAQMVAAGELQQMAGQIQIDTVEAQTGLNIKGGWFANLLAFFVSGWRPGIGWLCGLGLFYQFFAQPVFTALVTLHHPGYVAPTIEGASLNDLLMALLGLGAMRTVDKIKGVGSGH